MTPGQNHSAESPRCMRRIMAHAPYSPCQAGIHIRRITLPVMLVYPSYSRLREHLNGLTCSTLSSHWKVSIEGAILRTFVVMYNTSQ